MTPARVPRGPTLPRTAGQPGLPEAGHGSRSLGTPEATRGGEPTAARGPGALFGAGGLWSTSPIATLVRVDARAATIVRWERGHISTEHLESEVPPHEKSVGRVRHDPATRHGGGYAQTTIESDRIEHLARFLDAVVARLPTSGPIEIVGHGPVPMQLARMVRTADVHHRRSDRLTCMPTPLLTERQLVARLRDLVGVPAPRRKVGPEH